MSQTSNPSILSLLTHLICNIHVMRFCELGNWVSFILFDRNLLYDKANGPLITPTNPTNVKAPSFLKFSIEKQKDFIAFKVPLVYRKWSLFFITKYEKCVRACVCVCSEPYV